MSQQIVGFRGKHYWLANAHPVCIEYRGHRYGSVQDAMATVAPEASTPLAIRLDHCVELLKLKFASNKLLRAQLLATDKALLVNKYEAGLDTGISQEEKLLWGVVGSRGKNVLGQLLMGVRNTLRKEVSLSCTKETLPPFGGGK